MSKRRAIRLTAIVLALLMPILAATIAWGSEGESPATPTAKYASPDINELMGAGQEPEDISVSAGATYQEKAWYEYVMYSEHAVASYRLDDNTRVVFYDPYTYTNSLVMDVKFDAATTEFDTMSSYSISHTSEKTITACAESTYTNTESTQTSGVDLTGSTVKNTGKTNYNHHIDVETSGTVEENSKYYYKEYESDSKTVGSTFASATGVSTGTETSLGLLGIKADFSETITIGNHEDKTTSEAWLVDKVTNETVYSPNYKTSTKYLGSDTVDYDTTSTTEGWTQLSARVTKTVGSTRSTSNSWSEKEGVTVTKIYAATHFASDGVTPLPWAIVHYQVQMPMKCSFQVKYSGEWVTVSTVYCLLTTVKGTCRAWMENGQVYYEDWGSGEPVMETQFWAQFMMEDQLMDAYKDKLYPTGGED